MIRKATLVDIKTVQKLITEQAKAGHLLARALTDLYSQVRDFTVRLSDDTGEVIGCGALHIVWEDLAEIRSLAVTTRYQQKGIGSELVTALLEEARQMGVRKVFVLTVRTGLFGRLGFSLMDKAKLPHKIWADCIHCTKFPECDEVALVKVP